MNKITTDIIKNKNKKQKAPIEDDKQIADMFIERFDAVSGDDMPLKFSSEETKRQYFVPILEKFEHIRFDGSQENTNKINLLRKEFLQRSTKFNSEPPQEEYWRADKKWEDAISASIASKNKALLLEPRWLDEIFTFKKRFNIQSVYGVASFSTNEHIVSIGDVHVMKFDDNFFDVIYQRNVLSLSYDVRALLNECIRVLKNDGILIIDNALDYNNGVNPIIRTNIHSLQWVIEFLKNNTNDISFSRETALVNDPANKYGQLIIKIRK